MYDVVKQLLDPMLLLMLGIGASLIGVWRCGQSRGRAMKWLAACYGLLFIVSLPVVSYLAAGSLEWQTEYRDTPPKDTQAIVVLSGSLLPRRETRAEAQVGPDTMYRCLHGMELYLRGASRCPVVVSGGAVDGKADAPPLAVVMRDFLIRTGLPDKDILVEDQSKSTHENALFTARLLKEQGIRRVTLVTAARHMLRARLCFQAAGLEVTPAPCEFRTSEFECRWRDFLPRTDAPVDTSDSLREWLGLAWYRLHGRL